MVRRAERSIVHRKRDFGNRTGTRERSSSYVGMNTHGLRECWMRGRFLSLFHSFAFELFRPATESVLVGLLSELVADPDSYIAICVTAILFFDH